MIYYPYFRGRQFDLRALTEFAGQAETPNVMPIIEPVRDVPALPKTIETFSQRQQPLAVIQNPQVDHYHFQAAKRYPIEDLFQQPEIQRAYILTPLLPPQLLANSLVIVQHYADLKLFLDHDWLPDSATLLVPPEARIRRLLTGRRFGHLFDHYAVPEHSFEFTQLPDSFWSNDIEFAQQYHEIGFSDYLTQGAPYFERGHPSRIVTLHLIYLANDQVRIRHFVSDQHEDFKHQRNKFFEALTKAVAWIKTQPVINQTTATTKLVALADEHHFPGMGVLKALTIEHHLEIMARYLKLTAPN
ncbi:sce7725 family protein [Secundilactobacillus hailunensis]|uniref:Sce7725 family protein n=1 Tax=Secundilactobacillus hailunensis TaxID=2559923 RepID=A0ABW1TC84_9LACO|nr:sce7725 family protein [Secundilactobacillus hailunensis]